MNDALERANRLEHQLGEANETIRTLRGDLHAERATNKVLSADVERLEREGTQQTNFKYLANQRADAAEGKLTSRPEARARLSAMPIVKTLKDQRDEVATVLRELLRLYDWRNELGRIERDFNHDK